MTTLAMNQALAEGRTDETGVLPKLDELRPADTVFRYDFGLDSLTEEPGVLILRGARQYGKSTWLQQQIFDTIATFGPGSAYYLDGDEIRNATDLRSEIRTIVALYRSGALVRRLFIDEITSVADWQSALKTLVDRGELSSILVVTTGSQAEDLRRGSERLPGRKGKLSPSSYIFGPVSYSEFATKATGRLDPGDVVPAYVLSGGSPVACAELLVEERLPNYVVELVRDWVNGAFARAGRSRASLLGVLDCL